MLRVFFGPLGFITSSVVTWAVRNKFDVLVAILWRISMLRKKPRLGSLFSRKTLIVLERQGGREDVENAYFDSRADYVVLFLPRLILKASCHYYLGHRVSDLAYFPEDSELEESKIAYRDHLVRVLWWFKLLFGLSAILQFNIIYYAERELAKACRQVDVNFVCLQKEGNWSPIELDFLGKFYKDAAGFFDGEAIAYYSSTSRKLYEEAGVAPRSRGYVVGCARVDSSHRLRMSDRIRSDGYVLYYLIEELSGLTQMPISERPKKGWIEMARVVNTAMLEVALENPYVNFVVKAKSGHDDSQVSALKSLLPEQGLPPNLAIARGGSGHSFLRDSSVVVGFNSTAVLEAVAAGIPTIVPHIFSNEERLYSSGAHMVTEGVRVVGDEDALKQEIMSAHNSGTRQHALNDGQKVILERMLGNSDGLSGSRLRSFLDNAVYSSFHHRD